MVREYWEPNEIEMQDPTKGIEWRIPITLVLDKVILKSRVAEHSENQWQFVLSRVDETISVGIHCLTPHRYPYVEYTIKLVNSKKLSAISKGMHLITVFFELLTR